MTLRIDAWVRKSGLALMLAAAPVGLIATPVLAQIPGMPGMPTEPVVLTDIMIDNFIATYPAFMEAAGTLEQRYNLPAGADPATAFAALGAYGEAMADLNGIATANGFANYGDWLTTFMSVAAAFAFASPDMTAEQRTMMRAYMPPAMVPSDENIAAVAARFDELQAIIEAGE